MQTSIMRAMLSFALALFFFAAPLHAEEIKSQDGKTEFGFYMEFSYVNDRGLAWTGSEATFSTRLKADFTHRLYDDILVRAKGVWTPTVNEHTIGRDSFDKKEGNPEDVYIQFNNFSGRSLELRLGVVKLPFGHFDFMAFEDRNRPIGFSRTREWDYGMRLDTVLKKHGVSLAIVNGDGINGTDANSAKSVAIRVVHPVKATDSPYPETLEVPDYPNPLRENPDGAFFWQAGLSAYVGNRYSTPIKIKNSHYGFDFRIDYKSFSLKGQYSFLEGGFTDPGVDETTLTPEELSRADTGTFPRGYSVAAELAVGVTPKTMVTIMAERYDPDSESNNSNDRKIKTRIVLGAKYDYRDAVSAAFFFTHNDNPAFVDDGRGDNVYMLGVAAKF